MPGMEPLSDDLKELIALFKSNGVEFLVVGAHALAFHGIPRQTYDLDLWVRRSAENAHRIRSALDAFGFKIGEAGESKLREDRQMLVLGVEPNQVDVLTFLDGCDFETAWQDRKPGQLADEDVSYLSLDDYVKTKRASGRPKDLLDLGRLREVFGTLPNDPEHGS